MEGLARRLTTVSGDLHLTPAGLFDFHQMLGCCRKPRSRWGSDALLPPHACSEAVSVFLKSPKVSPWHEYRGRGPITKNQVAALLRDYDIRPVVVHPTKRADFSRHGYRAAHFDDAFARFLPHEPNIRTLKSGREGM